MGPMAIPIFYHADNKNGDNFFSTVAGSLLTYRTHVIWRLRLNNCGLTIKHCTMKSKRSTGQLTWCGAVDGGARTNLRVSEGLINSSILNSSISNLLRVTNFNCLISLLYGHAYFAVFHKQMPNLCYNCNKTHENSSIVLCMLDHTYTCTYVVHVR